MPRPELPDDCEILVFDVLDNDYGKSGDRPDPKRSIVRFTLGKYRYIDIHFGMDSHDKPLVEVRSEGRLVIQPRSSNNIHLTAER